MDAAIKIDNCGQTKCKEEYKAAVEVHKQMMNQLEELNKKLTNKSITQKQYDVESMKVREKMNKSAAKVAMSLCAFKHCQPAVSNLVNLLGDIFERECKVEKKKKACSIEKKARALAKSKTITEAQVLQIKKLASQ